MAGAKKGNGTAAAAAAHRRGRAPRWRGARRTGWTPRASRGRRRRTESAPARPPPPPPAHACGARMPPPLARAFNAPSRAHLGWGAPPRTEPPPQGPWRRRRHALVGDGAALRGPAQPTSSARTCIVRGMDGAVGFELQRSGAVDGQRARQVTTPRGGGGGGGAHSGRSAARSNRASNYMKYCKGWWWVGGGCGRCVHSLDALVVRHLAAVDRGHASELLPVGWTGELRATAPERPLRNQLIPCGSKNAE